MVAIFTGAGSGLERGSGNTIGSAGLLGTAAQGRSGEQLFVNAANGNLLIAQRDEFLVGRGPDVAVDRTYNALGNLSDDNGDNWRQSTERYVEGLTGTVNTSGSTVRRVAADGSSALYSWDGQHYVTRDGAGAYDSLDYSGGEWSWTDGDTQISERYSAYGSRWRIVSQSDADGNKLTYTYAGAQLSKVTTADGAWLRYGWSAANLVELSTGFDNEDQGSVVLTRTRYLYDTANRLTSVTVDLSPEDGSIDDAAAYVSTYLYQGASRLVSSIVQTDGSRVDFAYDAQGRITGITQSVSAGVNRTTSLAYGAGFTNVTDPRGQVTRLEYGADGSLTRIVAPPARPGEAEAVTSFEYTSSGDLHAVYDPLGRPTFHNYDSRGNEVSTILPGPGMAVRTYGAGNELLTERDTGSSSSGIGAPLTTRYVYDVERHLRYRIDPEGGVSEYRYDSYGQLTDTIDYPEHRFDTSALGQDAAPSEAALDAWRDGLADRSSVRILTSRYDALGNLAGTILYAAATVAGVALESPDDIRTFYAYDSSGRLLVRAGTGERAEAFAYDGLGRIVASSTSDGRKLSIAFLDASLKTMITHLSGRVQVLTYNAAGDLVSETETDSTGVPISVSGQRVDSLGRVRTVIDAQGSESHQLLDSEGRRIAEISALGEMSEYRFDGSGRPIASVTYAGRVSAAGLASLADPLATIDPAQLRPAASVDDQWEWRFQGDFGPNQTIDGNGFVVNYNYDASGQLIATTSFSLALSQAQLDSFKVTPPTDWVTTYSMADATRHAHSFYDGAGRPIGTLDAEGYLTRIRYDSIGQKIEEVAYANPAPAGLRDALLVVFDEALASIQTGAADRHTRYAYDNRGLLRYEIDAGDRVTGYQYDPAGRRTATIDYGAIAFMPSGFDAIQAALQQLGAADWPGIRERWLVYDELGRLIFSIDPEDAVTGYRYDEIGRVIRTIAYATRFETSGLPHPGVIGEWAEIEAVNPDNRVTRNYYNERDELIYTVDGEGYVTGNGYDALGRLTSVLRWPQKFTIDDSTALETLEGQLTFDWTGTRYAYDARGRPTDSWDGEGVQRHVDYNPDGTVSMETAAFGTADAVRTRYDYDGAGRLIARFDADGTADQSVTRFAYDAFGNAVSIIDPNGNVTARAYDRRSLLLSETDALGGVTRYDYDAFGDAIRIIDPLGSVTQKSYDLLGRVVRIVDAEDYVTENRYSMLGDLIEIVRRYAKGGAPNALDAVTRMDYDRRGKLSVVTDAEGGQQSFGRNVFGEEISYFNGIGWARFRGYSHRGLLDWETQMEDSFDSNGSSVAASVVTRFTYDERGNRTKMVQAEYLPEQRTTNYVYDKADRLIETRTDSVSAASQSDHMTAIVATPTRRFRYDARGNLVETVEANGARLLSYYDRRNRKIVQIDPLGTYSAWTYDSDGNMVASLVYENRVSLPAGSGGAPPAAPSGAVRRTLYGYDALNRLITTRLQDVRTGSWNGTAYATSVGDVVTTRVYDSAGNLIRTVDGNGKTSWSYFDRLGRMVAAVDRENYLTTWIRDSEGNVLDERRFAARLGSAPGSSAPVGTPSADDRETVFTYDRSGRRLTETRKGVVAWTIGTNGARTAASPDSTISYVYNALGKVVRKTEANGDIVDYSYDMAGRLVQEVRAGFTGWDGLAATPTVRYYYNAFGDLALTRQGNAALSAGDRFTRYSYGPAGRLASMTDAALGTTYYTYDVGGALITQAYVRQKSDGGLAVEGILYTRDLLGRVTSQMVATWTGSSWTSGDSQDTAYDSFGQVAKTGVNGLWQIQFAYDSAGRLWRSNEGDGVWRFFVRDGEGNQTLAIESEGTDLAGKSIDQVLAIATGNGASAVGAALVDGINATISLYDGRGQLIQTRLPKRELALGTAPVDISTSRAYNGFGELAYEIDAGGGRTDYAYNNMGRTVSIQRASVSLQLENGSLTTSRPTENYFYDLAGRLVGVQDANGNVNTRLLLAGSGHGGKDALVAAEFHPDGGIMRYGYDAFGDLRKTTDEIGRIVTMTYDGMGRLTASARGTSQVDYYSYDMLGRRLKHWTGELGAGIFDSSDYDAQGRVVRAVAMGGDVTTTAFTWSATLATLGMQVFGGWLSTTTYGNGRQLIEQSDFFGRDLYRKDLGGHEFSFAYDRAGRMTERVAAVEDSLTYYNLNTGMVGQIATMPRAPNTGIYNDRVTTYGYDSSGNLILERLVENSRPQIPLIGNNAPRTLRYNRLASATYDALGRMVGVAEQSPDMPGSAIYYYYDAVGNVRHVHSEYRQLDSVGTPASTLTFTDLWYRYDSMNRVVTSQGILSGAQIVRGTTGVDLLYDAAGQRVQSVRRVGSVDATERYAYDGLGNLLSVKIAQGSAAEVLRATYQYGALGRLSRQIDYAADGVAAVYDRAVTYNSKGQIATETVNGKQGTDSYQTANVYDYGTGSLYALGAVVAIATTNSRNNVVQPASRTENDFVWYGGAVQSVTRYWANASQTAAVFTSTYNSNAWGQLTSVVIADGRPRTVKLVNDMAGEVIRRDESDNSSAGDPHEIWYRFGGREHGYVGNNGTFETSYQDSIASRSAAVGTGAFRLGATTGTARADFDENYDPVTSYRQGSSGGSCSVQSGDTLSSIAAQLWGDASLWYKLAEANGMTASVALIEGQQLIVPAGVQRSSNTAATFNPYDPLDALGDTSPTTPKPQAAGKKKKCGGVFGTILLVIIAVAVTIITQGATLEAFPTIFGSSTAAGAAAGAAGAAAGSIASQGFGLATGLQDRFSWKGVALAAISGGVSGGAAAQFGEGATVGNQFVGNALRGAATNSLTQGIGIVTGLQDKFDWAGLAAAGVGSGLEGWASGRLRGGIGDRYVSETGAFMERTSPALGYRLVTGAAGAIGEAATRSLVEGTDFGDNILATLPASIGSSLGGAIAHSIVGNNDRTLVRGRLDSKPGVRRPMTPSEEVLAKAMSDELPYDRIEIVDGPGWNLVANVALLLMGNPAITWNDTVYVRSDKYTSDLTLSKEGTKRIAHELTHVRQYERTGVADVATSILAEAAEYGIDGSYGYQSRQRSFWQETYEGQASIVEDYTSYRYSGVPAPPRLQYLIRESGLYKGDFIGK
jgi:YD repeat-containing protein